MAFARKYPLELREGTVRLVFESGRPVLEVARDLGTSSIARETALLLSRPSCAAFTATRVGDIR
jgi:Transposase